MHRSPSFRPDIQGLRALAVLLVVLYHAGLPWLDGGFVGVDVFFVVSGFVITRLLRQELDTTGRIDFIAFYARRMRRLLPAALLVVAATVTFFWMLYSPLERQRLAAAAISAALYASNVWFASYAADYFAGGQDESPLLHTWSLSVEEQFYLLFPVLLVALHKLAPRRRGAPVVGLAALGAASFAACVVLTGISQPWAFFGPLTRAWEFAAGALVAHAARPLVGAWSGPLAAGGLAMILLSAVLLDRNSAFPGVAAALPVLGAVALIVAGERGRGIAHRALTHRVAVWIGDHSYGWYLWHWPVLMAMKELQLLPEGAAKPAAVAGSLALAWWMAGLIENPIRHHRAQWLGHARTAGLGVALSIVAAFGFSLTRLEAQREAKQPALRAIQQASEDRPSRLYSGGCHASVFQTEPTPGCTFGRNDGDRTIVLFGDSHAAHWFPALELIAQQRGYRLVPVTKSDCPSVDVQQYLAAYKRPYHECDTWRRKAIEYIVSLRPEAVIVSNLRLRKALAGEGRWLEGLDATLKALTPSANRVLVFGGTPHAPFNVPVCLARAAAHGDLSAAACTFAADSHAAGLQEVEAVVGRYPNARMVDVGRMVCPGERCLTRSAGHIVYTDYTHLTAAFSASLAPGLARHLSD